MSQAVLKLVSVGQTDVQTDVQADVQADVQTDVQADVQAEVRGQCVSCLQSRVLNSSGSRSLCVSSDSVLSLDLSSLLSVLSHTESALQWRHEELQVRDTETQTLSAAGQRSRS